MTTSRPRHARTSSDPPKPHPIVLKLEEELNNLKAGLSAASAPCTNAPLLCDALRELGNLHRSVDDLPCLQSPVNQPFLKRWVEEQLGTSIKLLELTESTKDCMASTREYIQDLRWAAMRRKGDPAYVASKKTLEREVRACFKFLKLIEGSCMSTSLVKDGDLMMADKALTELREAFVALFRSILHSLSATRCKVKARMWGFVSKDGGSGECSKEQDQLRELEGSIGGLEEGLEVLLRRLIQNRVSLLNLLSL